MKVFTNRWKEWKNRLMKLHNQGYKIPDYVFEQIENDLG